MLLRSKCPYLLEHCYQGQLINWLMLTFSRHLKLVNYVKLINSLKLANFEGYYSSATSCHWPVWNFFLTYAWNLALAYISGLHFSRTWEIISHRAKKNANNFTYAGNIYNGGVREIMSHTPFYNVYGGTCSLPFCRLFSFVFSRLTHKYSPHFQHMNHIIWVFRCTCCHHDASHTKQGALKTLRLCSAS